MGVKLRLRRMGKKRQPVYKVVAADVRSPRDGKFIEAIGLYNPRTEPATVEIQVDRVNYWLSVGALPTTTVKNILQQEGILYKRDLEKKGLSEEEIAAKMDEWNQQKEAKAAKADKAKQDKQKAADKAKAEELKAKEEAEKAEQEKAEAESKKEEATKETTEETTKKATEEATEESTPEVKGAASKEADDEEKTE